MEFTITESRWTTKYSKGKQASTKAYKVRLWISLALLNGTPEVEMVMEFLEAH
jgi:hypothetical protein